ncbi:hypothetical protein C922_03383 [Plasmodium inui San Antonio 1]|uniref:Uncharacterized protein n=1 Tax=Plasmodium inui San Antonio 1 TaxID=1237626 RepID=W7A4G9_9APIC|nr:hypothetical protein C922_03383 [Plasmodium inui San Antonio 1]EUD66188.1 hypothetical protein C922_03383 [Plasmodium inui San Antonio 1]
MKTHRLLQYVAVLYFVVTCLNPTNVRGAQNARGGLASLNDNVLVAFLLLVQLEVPHFLGPLSLKEKYGKVIDGAIYLLTKEVATEERAKEQRGYTVQDVRHVISGMNSLLNDIRSGNENYFTWMELITNECWREEDGCRALSTRSCTMSVLNGLPKKTIPVTCSSCIMYAVNYALHSKLLFTDMLQIQNCNEEGNLKLINLSKDVGMLREYRIYLNSLETISVANNVRSEVIILHIEDATKLVHILRTYGHERFTHVMSDALMQVIKKSIQTYRRHLLHNSSFSPNGENEIKLDVANLISLTINGYLYLDQTSGQLLRVRDFGLFFTEDCLEKCVLMLTGKNLFVQVEMGTPGGEAPENGLLFPIGNLLTLIEFELVLNSYLHFGENYFSKAVMLMKKVFYVENKNGKGVFSYGVFNYGADGKDKADRADMADEANRADMADGANRADMANRGVVDNLLGIAKGGKLRRAAQGGHLRGAAQGGLSRGGPKGGFSRRVAWRNHLNSAPPNEYTKRIEEFKKTQLELMNDQTVFFIILMKSLPENKYKLMQSAIAELLTKPVYSNSLKGFSYNDEKKVNKELIEVMGESYNDPINNVKRRTKHFGSRINKREILAIEQLIHEGYKLSQIAFHNYSSLPLNSRKNIYSAVKMFSLFKHRVHYLTGWDAQILFSKRIYPEDMVEKNYNVHTYPQSGGNYWFIICCTVIPILVIILAFLLYKYLFHKKLKFSFPFRHKKYKKGNHGSSGGALKYYRHLSGGVNLSRARRRHADRAELQHLLRRRNHRDEMKAKMRGKNGAKNGEKNRQKNGSSSSAKTDGKVDRTGRENRLTGATHDNEAYGPNKLAKAPHAGARKKRERKSSDFFMETIQPHDDFE